MIHELSYEQQRLQNIKDNEALLLSLGLSNDRAKVPLAPKKTVPAKPKIKSKENNTYTRAIDDEELPKRSISNVNDSPSGLRRSGRTSLRPSYLRQSEKEDDNGANDSPHKKRSRTERDEDKDDDDDDDEEDVRRGLNGRQRNAQRLGLRTQEPKTFGLIPGVEVGRWWATRIDASTDAVHAPTVAGISGNAQDGAWSVALSGGYPDDIDLGYAFTYTGCGGRDLKGTKQNPKNLRTAPQTSHQTFDNALNAALKRSAETRNPVRVIRGFKLQSKYAPQSGYRYDGLYIVEKAWMGKGLTKGLMVCRYAFKRVEGQDAIPEQEDAVVDE